MILTDVVENLDTANEWVQYLILAVPALTSISGVLAIARMILNKMGINKEDVKEAVETVVSKVDNSEEIKDLIAVIKSLHQDNIEHKALMNQMIKKGLVEEVVNPHERKNKDVSN